MDLMFPYDTVILTVIDCNTRYAYARLLKSKEKKDVVPAMRSIFKECRPVLVQSDNGGEFLNDEARKVYTELGVTHQTVEKGDHRGQGMIERFNQTLRSRITTFKDSGGDWKKHLQDLMENYNHRDNRSIHMEPAEATEFTGLYDRYLQQQRARAKDTFKVGDTVRKLIQKQNFEKGRDRYTQDTFTIVGRSGNGWDLSDGSHKLYYQLQYIKGVAFKAPMNLEQEREAIQQGKSLVRKKRKEGVMLEEPIEFDGAIVIGTKIQNEGHMGHVVEYKKSRRGNPLLTSDWWVQYDKKPYPQNADDKGLEDMTLKEIGAYSINESDTVRDLMNRAIREEKKPVFDV